MEKTSAMKREILMSLIQRYGHKEPKVLITKAKERGLYHVAEDDNEIYTLMSNFAKFHKLPFGFQEQPKEVKEVLDMIVKGKEEESKDPFLDALLNERSLTVKRLVALDKLIKTYVNE